MSLATRDRRALALGAMVVVGLLIGRRLVPSYLEWRRSTIATSVAASARWRRAQETLRRREATRDSLIARRVRLAARDSAFAHGGSPALEAASLAETVGAIASDVGVTLGSTQLQEDTTVATFRHPRIQIGASTDIAGVVKFVRAIEAGSALLAVRELTVTAAPGEQSPGSVQAIRIDLTIEGIARGASANGGLRHE